MRKVWRIINLIFSFKKLEKPKGIRSCEKESFLIEEYKEILEKTHEKTN